MPKAVEMGVEVIGWKDFERALQQKMVGRVTDKQRIEIFLRMLYVSAKPMVVTAKAFYKGFAKSGSLQAATRAYRWKNPSSNLKKEIRIGPKRSNLPSLRRWISYYRRPVTPATFTYGIRHAHLVEWGFRHVRSKRRVPGKRTLEKAGNASKGQVPRVMAAALQNVVNKAVAKEMRKRTRSRWV